MSILDDYVARTPRSRELFERATGSLPGGSTRTTVYTAPYPPYVASGSGLRIRDVDGNEYRDFLCNYTSLILGHAHPDVVAAVEAQVRRGSAFAAPTETEVELAEEIRRRVPSIERLRFTSSGTEATMFAMRAARAFTGRPLIAKFERSYHGTHDGVMTGTPGVPEAMDGLVAVLPWGDPDAIEATLRGRLDELAAIIIEPVQGAGGVRAPDDGFLGWLRDLADRAGALLIFDEIISFRVAPGGAQERFGVRPDLTTLGKIIGGGYPLAAFGGRADVMGIFDARRPGAISHGGTFNGSPVAAAAGLATLRALTRDTYARLDDLGERLRARVAATIEREGLDARVTAVGSLFQVFPGAGSGSGATAFATGVAGGPTLFLALLLDGFYLAPRGMGAIPAIATERDVDDLADAIGRALATLAETRAENLPQPDRPLCHDCGMTSETIEISALTARHYVMGRGGLWPGRRWRGLDGTGTAMRTMEDLQLDPLVIVARAHDLMLHSRVADYVIDDWATLTYERREFFEWGGWLAVRPMEELPYFRVLMRREREKGHWLEVERDHHDAIEEMRALLRDGREVSNRSFAMGDRTRIDNYRGRKDSALALHYLWRVGEAMVARRDRFERVYALTEAVAPPSALREVDEAEADDVLALKAVAAAGLTRLNGVRTAYAYGHKATRAEEATMRDRWLSDGSLVEVKVEGWRAAQVAPGTDATLITDLEAGRVPEAWTPLETTTEEEATFLSPLDPVSARGRAKPLFGFDYVWEVYKPVSKRTFGYYTMPILWGDRLVGRFDPKLDRTTGTLVILGLWLEDEALAKDGAFADALATGMRRFMTLLGVVRIDAAAVTQTALRRSLAKLGRRR